MYTVTITWNVPLFGKRKDHYTFSSYTAAKKLVDACKTSASFISALIAN